MKVIVLANPKGGCGKTTISTNMACFFSRLGDRVTILDADSQSSTCAWHRARSTTLPPITSYQVAHENLLERLSSMKESNEDSSVVLIDLPASFEPAKEVEIYPLIDVLVVPTLASPIDTRAMVRHVFDLYKSSNSLEQLPNTGVIVNQAKSRTIMYRHLLDDVLERMAFPVIGTLRDTQNYPIAAMDGMGIVELPARRVIKDLLEWRPIMEWLMQNLYPARLSELDEMFAAIGKK